MLVELRATTEQCCNYFPACDHVESFENVIWHYTSVNGQVFVCISGSRPEVWRLSLQQQWGSQRDYMGRKSNTLA